MSGEDRTVFSDDFPPIGEVSPRHVSQQLDGIRKDGRETLTIVKSMALAQSSHTDRIGTLETRVDDIEQRLARPPVRPRRWWLRLVGVFALAFAIFYRTRST